MTAGALLAFTACSNDSDGITPATDVEAQVSDIELIVSVPGTAATRGVLEDGVEVKTASVKGVIAYLMDGETKVGDVFVDKIDAESSAYKLEMKNVSVKDGISRLVIIGYNNDAQKKEALNIPIADVQPTGTLKGIANSAYAIDVLLKAQDNNLEGKKTEYKVEVGKKGPKTTYTVTANMKSIAARVEMSENIQYNKNLVKSAYVSHIIPMGYRDAYKGGNTINGTGVKEDNKTLDVTTNQLAFMLEQPITDWGKQVVANHLFDGDKQLFNIALTSTLYDCVMSKKNPRAYLTVNVQDIVGDVTEENVETSVIFKGNDDNKGKFYAVKVSKEGNKVYYAVEYIAETDTYYAKYETPLGEEVSHKNFATKDDIRWFTIGNFNYKDGGENVGKQGIYSGGHIYKLDFSKGLTWKGENETEFSPDVDGGTEEPQVTQIVDILATVKVLDWTEGNYTTEVN